MKAGDTFYLGSHEDEPHLRVVISDPLLDSQRVLIVNFTSWKYFHDQSCVVEAGEHPRISRKSCVRYDQAVEASDRTLETHVASGDIHLNKPVSQELLNKIRQGALGSELPMKYVKLLQDQGLIK